MAAEAEGSEYPASDAMITKRSRTSIFDNVIRNIPMAEDYHRRNSCQLSAPHNMAFRRHCGTFAAKGHVVVDRFDSLHLATMARSRPLRTGLLLAWMWKGSVGAMEGSALSGHFLAAFGAAAILPFQSEPILVGLHQPRPSFRELQRSVPPNRFAVSAAIRFTHQWA